jgi:hypothetical protein
MRTAFIALLLSAPCSAHDLPNPRWPEPAERGAALLEQTALRLHNEARAEFGVPPVRWSQLLAAEALKHAQFMAATGAYGHDRTPGRRKLMGENLWRGDRGVFSYDVMIKVMIDEKRFFVPGAFPANTSTKSWHDVAHYTQIVWPSTTEIGCALSSSRNTDYFVCCYAPTGNKDGIFLSGRQDPLAPLPAAGGQLSQRSH